MDSWHQNKGIGREMMETTRLHHRPSHGLDEAVWSQLGDALRDCEFPVMHRIPGERYITLRLDGSGSLVGGDGGRSFI